MKSDSDGKSPDNFWEGSLVVTAVTTVTFLKELPPQRQVLAACPQGSRMDSSRALVSGHSK